MNVELQQGAERWRHVKSRPTIPPNRHQLHSLSLCHQAHLPLASVAEIGCFVDVEPVLAWRKPSDLPRDHAVPALFLLHCDLTSDFTRFWGPITLLSVGCHVTNCFYHYDRRDISIFQEIQKWILVNKKFRGHGVHHRRGRLRRCSTPY